MVAMRKNIERVAQIDVATVASSQSIGQGIPVIIDASGEATPVTAATSKATHLSYTSEDGTWPATEGDKVSCIKLGSPCTAPVKVGTGGATIGEYGSATTDGVTDDVVGGGTTLVVPICEFMQTGVAGDLVGGWLGVSRTVG